MHLLEIEPIIVRVLVSATFLLTASISMAGGEFALGKVVAFSNDSDSYLFRFVQTDGNKDLLKGCREFNVKVHYVRVPWFSWLPFVQSGHPTKQQTKIAASLLHVANQSGQEIYFGYMGHGLVQDAKQCSFSSRGMYLDQEKGKNLILSYHDEI